MNPAAAWALIGGLSFLSLWFGMALVFFDRWHRRHVTENQARREDQQLLLQRIQAPEQAVTQHAVSSVPRSDQPTYVPLDNDEAYWDAKMPADLIGVNPINGHDA